MKTIATILWYAARLQINAIFFLIIFGTGSVEAQFATAHPSYAERKFLKGPAGETVSDVLFKNYGWTKIKIKPLNPEHGLDAVFVKRTSSGAIKDVLFVESKTEGAQLSSTVSGASKGAKPTSRKNYLNIKKRFCLACRKMILS